MKTICFLLGLIWLSCTGADSLRYKLNNLNWNLQSVYQGSDFFDNFNFWNSDDPTHGYVNYVDYGTAASKGYIKVVNNVAYLGTDTQNVASGRGRDSVRLESKASFVSGTLFIADIAHMPTGCGTWPAYWFCGANWPHGGEIDVIEGINNGNANQMTLHTDSGCWMDTSLSDQFTGTWAKNVAGGPSNNCDVNDPGQYSNAGCGIIGATDSYGPGFNGEGGGVYATLWTENEISVYYFPRYNIPQDIQIQQPNPANWGKPSSKFQIGDSSNCPLSHFAPQKMIINLTFCGDWAGSAFGQMCPNLGACADHVRDHPEAFTEAYWAFNSIKIYRQ